MILVDDDHDDGDDDDLSMQRKIFSPFFVLF